MIGHRRWLLATALLLPALPGGAQGGDSEVAPPVAAVDPSSSRLQPVPMDVPQRGPARSAKRDIFAPHSWLPPRPVAPKPKPPPELHGPPAPPPPPPPPPLSLTYLGQMDMAGEATTFYLAQGDRVFAVSVGDTVADVYKLLAQEGRQLTLLYLPLDVKQSLPLGPAPR